MERGKGDARMGRERACAHLRPVHEVSYQLGHAGRARIPNRERDPAGSATDDGRAAIVNVDDKSEMCVCSSLLYILGRTDSL